MNSKAGWIDQGAVDAVDSETTGLIDQKAGWIHTGFGGC